MRYYVYRRSTTLIYERMCDEELNYERMLAAVVANEPE
jgi:hypothetical protein